ncbi:MAG: hydroxymethylglutaryl-CoA synthase, partial [Verrucomicrobia bacterium]|nr:hydroxymethylglutaryl-CoA synthase [Verrucomicrobiota bacterium]
MRQVGIEALHFYTSRYFLDLELLASKRGVETNKFFQGLGQEKMAVLPPDEDIVTLAATSATGALKEIDPNSIAMVLAATESGVDHSKAYGIWVHHLL